VDITIIRGPNQVATLMIYQYGTMQAAKAVAGFAICAFSMPCTDGIGARHYQSRQHRLLHHLWRHHQGSTWDTPYCLHTLR
jgi:hypothetical protein